VPINIPATIERLCDRYPSTLVDAILEHEPGRRIVAVKNVTVNEDFFQGHFPGTPMMPGVLMIETLAQVATLLLADRGMASPADGTYLRGVDNAKFRRQVVPGDRLTLDVTLGARRARLARAHAVASIDEMVVAEAELVMGIVPAASRRDVSIHPAAIVHEGAQLGPGTAVGPYAVVGPHVRMGAGCKVGASAVVDGSTEMGDGNEIFPFASIGLIPQDLKFRGEPTRLVIGSRNVFREFVTIHRGTEGGGGLTRIARHRRGLRDHQRVLRRAPVLPGGAACLCRRLLGNHEGRPALCEERRQPRAPLRPEHDRPGAAAVLARLDQQTAPGLPLSSPLEHQPCAGPDRARPLAPLR
jgi:beta-hydroxyacyl-ACP dehydratase FabZ